MTRREFFNGMAALIGLGAVAGFVYVVGPAKVWEAVETRISGLKPAKPAPPVRPKPAASVRLVAGATDEIELPADVAGTLGIRTAPAELPKRSRTLELSGSLALDTNRLAHVHTRFVGEVIELGSVGDPQGGTNGGRGSTRAVRFGDRVEKGQLLAVLWSSELGEKKSEYVDALSRARMENETLVRQEALFKSEATPEKNLREARRAVESSQIAVARVERTLRSWRLSDAEILSIQNEVQQMKAKDVPRDPEREKAWARVELRAPLAGTILEVNLAVGDIVATDTDLFKIADLNTLRVWAHVYEEDLPILAGLPRPIAWTIQLKAEPGTPPIHGTIERLGDIIDPAQHTALVVGQVENPDGRMKAGQFINASVAVPPDPRDLEIPIAALVEDGVESLVFTQPDPSRPAYAMRSVAVVRRSGASAHVRPGAAPEKAGRSLKRGDRVVISGAVELRAALAGLQGDAGSAR